MFRTAVSRLPLAVPKASPASLTRCTSTLTQRGVAYYAKATQTSVHKSAMESYYVGEGKQPGIHGLTDPLGQPIHKSPPQLTKIVATVGPTSEQMPNLQYLVDNGMRIMRLNFSHATREEVELRMSNLQKCKVNFLQNICTVILFSCV